MNSNTEPKLAPPGAGLPAIELRIARLMFAARRWITTRDGARAHFQREREAIRALIHSCDEESGARRVLIARVRGLEDSSRYWSVWMTLDHLRIVNREIGRVIRSLTSGVMPEGTASTATVKPSADATAAVIVEYEQSCDALNAVVAGAPDLNTALRYAHPWFGPLNAAGWHALAGGHMGIHRAQIARIMGGLASAAISSASGRPFPSLRAARRR